MTFSAYEPDLPSYLISAIYFWEPGGKTGHSARPSKHRSCFGLYPKQFEEKQYFPEVPPTLSNVHVKYSFKLPLKKPKI